MSDQQAQHQSTQQTRDWPRPRVTPRLYSPRDALMMRRTGGRTRLTRMYPRADVAWIERTLLRRRAAREASDGR